MSPALDPALRARALACVPGCEDGQPPLEMSGLAGGTANAAYHVRSRRGTFALRFNDPRGALLGVDRRTEVALHAHAARARIAPQIIAADPAGEFLITEFIPGAPWRREDLGNAARLAQLAARLRALHALAPPSAPEFDVAALLHAHAARLARTDPVAAQELAPLLQRARRVLERFDGASRRRVIVHNDLHHTNVLQATDGLYLIDWEYSAVADPLYDLACLLAYYPEADQHAELLLETSGLAPYASHAVLRDAAWLYTLLSYLWYRGLRLEGTADAAAGTHERELWERLQRRAGA